MVLGRIEGAPSGVKGISLFVVPKVLVNADGSLGARNEVRCLSIEHKLGIHASPTCVLAFGEQSGAHAWIVGEPGRGLEYMFIMMNSARLSVGSEGYAVGERALQRAARVGAHPHAGQAAGSRRACAHHQSPRRQAHAAHDEIADRGLARADAVRRAAVRSGAVRARERARARAQARGELLTPIVKGWCTEIGNEVAAIGVQVHGGMGYIEETGAAQYLRDVRITTIYEGTTGIQSNDLIGRKLARDRGAAMAALLDDMERELAAARLGRCDRGRDHGKAALDAVRLLRQSTQSLLGALATRVEAGMAVSVPYLKLCGYVAGGWLLAQVGGARRRPRAAARSASSTPPRSAPRRSTPRRCCRARWRWRASSRQGGASVADTDAALL